MARKTAIAKIEEATEKITTATVRKVKLKGRTAWRGVLKYTKYKTVEEEGDDGKKERKLKPVGSRQVTKTFPATVRNKTQATAALVKWRAEVEAEAAAPDASLTVQEYARAYIDSLERGKTVEPSTIAGYEKSWRRVGAAFPNVRLRDLTSKQVEQWRDEMLASGLSAVSVCKHLGFLRMVCNKAVGVKDLTWNPCNTHAVKPPQKHQTEPASLDAATVRRLAARLRESEPTPLIVSAAIALYTGMREGEICALRWVDIDLEDQIIHVRRAVGVGKGGDYLKVPKNESSRRDIPIPSELVTMLERRRAVQFAEWAAMRMKAGVSTSKDEFDQLCVTGEVDGNHAVPATISRGWKQFAADNGIHDTKGDRATFHTLRHSYASLLISQGYEAVTVAKLLGHAKPSMTTDVYSAAFEARKKAAAKSIGDAIGAALAAPEPAEVLVFDKASNG